MWQEKPCKRELSTSPSSAHWEWVFLITWTQNSVVLGSRQEYQRGRRWRNGEELGKTRKRGNSLWTTKGELEKILMRCEQHLLGPNQQHLLHPLQEWIFAPRIIWWHVWRSLLMIRIGESEAKEILNAERSLTSNRACCPFTACLSLCCCTAVSWLPSQCLRAALGAFEACCITSSSSF